MRQSKGSISSTSPTSLSYNVTGDSKTINVTADFSDWAATDNRDWLQVSKSGNTVQVTCSSNTTAAIRTGTITISGRGASKTVSVSQEAAIISNVSVSNLSYAVQEETKSAIVTANFTDWNVTSDKTWITVTKVGNQVNITCEGNPTNLGRAGIVTISGRGNSKTVNIFQEASIIESLPVTELLYVVSSGSKTIDITANFTDWIVSDNADWITTSKSNGQVTIICSDNTSSSVRLGTVTISGRGNEEQMSIRQNKGVISSVTPTSLSYSVNGGNKSVNVTADFNDWTVTDNRSWLQISKSSNTVQVTCNSNTTASNRTGTITISGRGSTKTVSISQEAAVIQSVSKTNILFPVLGGTNTATVTSNFSDWTVSDNASWLQVSKSGSNVTITCSDNNTNTTRTGTVTISGRGNTKTINISQTGALLSVNAPVAIVAGVGGKSGSLSVTTNFSDWTVSDNASWISVSKSTDKFNYTVSSNPNASSRTGSITVSGRGNSQTIPVEQTGVSLSVDKTSLNYTNVLVRYHTVNVTSNRSWTVSKSNSFIVVSRTSGSGNSSFTITCSENSGAPRTGSVTVTAGNVTRTIQISQDGKPLSYTLDGVVNKSPISVGYSGATKTIQISSGTSWTVSDNRSWISVSGASGSGDGSATIQIANNTSSSSRSGTITISSGGETKTISVTQAGYSYLTTNVSRLDFVSFGGTSNFTISSNSNWTITTSGSWLTVSPNLGSGNGTISVQCAANASTMKRIGMITISCGSVTEIIAISQAGGKILR